MFSATSANWLAYIALVGFLPFGLIVFRLLPPTRAVLFLIFFEVLFLPQRVALDLPLLPKLGKESIGYLTVLVGLASMHWPILVRSRPGRGIDILIVVMVVGGMLTTFTNSDPLQYGPVTIQGMAPYEMITASLLELLKYGLPFYLGRALFRTKADLSDIFKALMLAGLVYTLFLAVELRLSPQMHRWTYGFHQNTFDTLKRWGGFRPMVYMESGIAVGIFMVTVVMAAWTSLRARIDLFGFSAKLIAPYVLVFLMLCKSVASMVWGAVFTPLLLVLSPRRIAMTAMLLACLVTFYPMLRMTNLFPWKQIVSVAESIDPDRARSLNYRFTNDENMLEKSRERFIFGWGGYSRNWAYDEQTGDHLTVPDGAWIIRFSSNGSVGFYTLYGLYVLPVLFAWLGFRRFHDRQTQFMIAGLMLIVIIRAVDQLPNGLYSSYPIFLAGALYNLVKTLPREQRATRRASKPEQPPAAQRLRSDPNPEASSTTSASTAELLGLRRPDREDR